MRVEAFQPDAPPEALPPAAGDATDFARALDSLGAVLGGAENAEDKFARGGGTLQDAIYARTRADVALSVATAAAQRTAQAISSILNMQV
ncbi:MAG: flagellar hook-basal body complex protein FliE [Candidatus Tumulicola sp.]